jgi:hypothetical protein
MDQVRDRRRQRAPQDRADRVESVPEPRDDAEVAAAAAHGPEQVRSRLLIGGEVLAVGGHDLDAREGVDREPSFRLNQPTPPPRVMPPTPTVGLSPNGR